MSKSKHLIVSLASLALTAGSAAAADMPLKAPIYTPPPPPPWTWTGFYVGGNVGYSFGNTSTAFGFTGLIDGFAVGTSSGSTSSKLNGWLGGAQAGYNWQIDRWVFGLEGDIQATGENDDPRFCSIPGCPPLSVIGTSTTQLPWFATWRGRLGVTSNPASGSWPVMLYATGGLAIGEVDAKYTGGLVGLPIGADSIDATRAGWTVGGGAEARLGQSNWTMKLEYLYMDFGDVSASPSATTFLGGNGGNGGNVRNNNLLIAPAAFLINRPVSFTVATNATTHVTDQLVRLGFNYKFPPPQ